MRKGSQEKANNTCREIVGVKLGKNSRDHMVVSFKHLGKKFIFSSKSIEELLRVFWTDAGYWTAIWHKRIQMAQFLYTKSNVKLTLNKQIRKWLPHKEGNWKGQKGTFWSDRSAFYPMWMVLTGVCESKIVKTHGIEHLISVSFIV